jgi:hypothetical protein
LGVFAAAALTVARFGAGFDGIGVLERCFVMIYYD